MIRQSITVRIPATTANLGPGFDCLGMALNLWNQAVFSIIEGGLDIAIQGEGQDILPCDRENQIARSFFAFFEARRLPAPRGLRIRCDNRIPLGSGLGSSAAACLTGLMAANGLSGSPASKEEILCLATGIEGHPDNVAAALLGGLVIVVKDEDILLTRRFDVPDLHVAVVIPEIDLPTGVARAALPPQVPLKDAVFNLGRTALVCEAIRTGNYDLLGEVMVDRLHQPYRLPLIAGGAQALQAAIQAGASAAAISGAGPGLIAFCGQGGDKPAAAMAAVFEQRHISSRKLLLSSSNQGAVSDII
jgi:homoserine kinase